MNTDKIRILLVEDNERHAGLIRRTFEAHGPPMSLTVVDTLREAQGLLAQSSPHLLIVDMLLPDGLGMELLPGDQDARKFPAIVMTSFGNEQAAVNALRAGAIDYVVKSEATLADMPRIAERALRQWESIAERRRAEEALRESEQRHRDLAELLPETVFEMNRDGTLKFVNRNAFEMFGYTRADFDRGLNVMDLLVPDDRERAKVNMARVLRGEVPGGNEYTVLRNDGAPMPVMIFSTPVVRAGKPVGLRGIIIDLTEQKRAEESLRKSEEKYRTLVETAQEGIGIVDAEENILFVNQAYADMLGYSKEELLGLNLKEIASAAEFAKFRQQTRKRFRHESSRYETVLKTKSGETRQISISASPLFDDGGAFVGTLGLLTDVTSRERAAKALRDGEFRLAMAIECTGLGLWDEDLRTGTVIRGDNWTRMLGYEPGEIERDVSAWMQLIHPDDKPRVEECMRDHEAGLTPIFSVEHRMRTKSGQWKWIRNWGRIIRRDENGKAIRAIGVHLDVDESKRAAEELARAKDAAKVANRAKSEFLANMSHEIRTPMTAIMGFTDLLMSYEMPPAERREHLQTIHRNAESLLTIINDILDLSKIEAEKIELEHTDYTPREIVDEVLSLMKVRANEKNLSLDAQYVYPLPKTIRTDAVRLRQILLNLVGNAVKFTEQGRVRITVRCGAAEGSRPQIVFEVMDTGIGMEPEDVDRLFQPFVQADASHTRRFGGTGLGLSISGRLAKMLGGRIDVQSRPGRGSTFTVSIDLGPADSVPLLDGPPSAAAEEQLPAEGPPGMVLRGRVLLVEDSPDIQDLVLLVLQHWGLEVDVACNGRIGCEKALQSQAAGVPYDLILMDIQLPEMDGYQATQYLRHHDWSGPVVALTAHAMAGDRQRCLAAGCDDYVPKPITAEELLHTLAGYLGDSSGADTLFGGRPAADGSPDKPLGSGILDAAEVAELVDAFVGELPDRAEAIQEALKTQDLPALTLRTHQLKGTAAIYGLPRISRAAAVANQRASQPDDFEQLEAAVTELIGLCRAAVSQSYGRPAEEGQNRVPAAGADLI